MKITKKLFELQDKEYAEFQSKLTPNVDKDKFIGVRVPDVRKLAKQYIQDDESTEFMNSLPHKYYDEDMLHGLLISEIKDYNLCVKELEKFLPYVDNWAVCDIMGPKILKKYSDEFINKIKQWVKSKHTYTCRFAIKMLMSNYLDKEFKTEYLEIPVNIHSDEYYINMVIAWFYATALAKQWDKTILYLEQNKLNIWIHNRTIQKARESFRITDAQKEYLKKLKR